MQVTGYKNLKSVNFQLTDFNVLVGANNSGKSNILEIFRFLDEYLTGSDEIRDKMLGGIIPGTTYFRSLCNDVKDEKIVKVDLDFSEKIEGVEYKYWYSLHVKLSKHITPEKEEDGYIAYEAYKFKAKKSTGPAITIFERELETVSRIGTGKGLKIDKAQPALTIINKLKETKESLEKAAQIGMDAIFIICKTPVLYASPEIIRSQIKSLFIQNKVSCSSQRLLALNLDTEIDGILKSKNKETFLQVINSLLDIKMITSKRFNGESSPIVWTDVDFNNGSHCLLEMLSDGTLMTLNLITYLLSTKYPIIAIEEPENSIHPKLLRQIINLIKNNFSDRQVIITTHSPVLLNMVSIEDISVVSLTKQGIATIERVENKRDLVKRLSGAFASNEDIFYDFEEQDDICLD